MEAIKLEVKKNGFYSARLNKTFTEKTLLDYVKAGGQAVIVSKGKDVSEAVYKDLLKLVKVGVNNLEILIRKST